MIQKAKNLETGTYRPCKKAFKNRLKRV